MTSDEGERSGSPRSADTTERGHSRRRGRPPKGARQGRELRGTIVKRYMLTREDERTAGHLRQIVMQREVPDAATLSFDDSCLTIEWTCE